MDALEYLYGLRSLGMKLGLETMERLIEALDHPDRRFKSVHVAGTNGKGSTVAMLRSVLSQQGMRVGSYTSPHLFKFNERIRIGDEEISDEMLLQYAMRVQAAAMSEKLSPTFFEATTAIAFLHFAENDVDIGLIEVGLGGRLDATNVLTPLLSVITSIGMEHTEHLGETIGEIAGEKAGIIKDGVPVVVAEGDLFQEKATSLRAPMRDISEFSVTEISTSLSEQTFSVEGPISGTFSLSLLGAHQQQNACLALLAIVALSEQGISISDDAVREGLAAATWPGRLDVISRQPLIIADGAHNPEGMASLLSFLGTVPNKKVLIVGISQGKDVKEMVGTISGVFPHVIVTQGAFKPIPTQMIADALPSSCAIQQIPDPKKAVDAAFDLLGDDDCCIIAGSLYMIPEAITKVRGG